jgi:uncharacterized protein YndB with AHSA1/START domain
VWERLLDREHLIEWLTSESGGHIRHREGGEVHLPTVSGAVIESLVYEFVPEDTLVFGWETYEWDGGNVGWYLDREEGGTLLLFEHDDDALHPEHYARTLANWHVTLDRFEASLAGKPTPWSWEVWEAHYHRYEQWLLRLLQGGG